MRRVVLCGALLLLLGGAFASLVVAGLGADERSAAARSVPTRATMVPRFAPTHPRVSAVTHEVRRLLLDAYYRPVEPTILVHESVDEIIDDLGDPYTQYLEPDEYASLRSQTARTYSGVGLNVGQVREGLIVTAALEGPAREAGIRKGDVIVRIDGKPARHMTYAQSLALMKGEEGTIVRLAVRRPEAGVMRFTVVRKRIASPSLRYRMITVQRTKVGYVRLTAFAANAAERLETASTLLVENGAKGLVLDLRGNPGGLLDQAVRVVSFFLDKGVVCTVEGEHQDRLVYRVSGRPRRPKLPLVVLVDRGSASAAEIVAAALGDHRRAVVVGESTYGKTSVQSVVELSNGAALKLTTATYRTPTGEDIIGRGLTPGVAATDDPLTPYDEGVIVAEDVLFDELERIALRQLR